MYKILLPLILPATLAACNDSDDENDILVQPPFSVLSDSIRQFPDNARLYYNRGVLLYQNNQKALAEKDIRTAWQLAPSEEYALTMTTLLKEKNTDSAIVFLEGATGKIPESISLRIGLARGYQQKGQLDKALDICNQIIGVYPNQLDALLLKAVLLKEAKREPEMVATLEQAYRFAPQDAEVVEYLAFAYAETKNARAVQLADSLIRADTQNAEAKPYFIKGVYYANAGNTAEAVRQFDEAIRHEHNFLDAYINKGVVYYDAKRYEEALKTFNLAATVSPDEAEPYYWLAKTLEAVGNTADAKLNYQRAYGLDKTMTEAKERADNL